jgi:AcrR family transcriptional regulator
MAFSKMSVARTATVRQLRSGRHQYTREAVVASQRARLLDAVAEAVAAKGYAATTVADVVGRAAVSRRTFYEQFPDLESCFLTAYQAGMELLLQEIRRAVRARPGTGWRDRARTSIEAYFKALAARPSAAWAFSIEGIGAGAAVLEHRAGVLDRWVQQWRELHGLACREDPAVPPTSDEQLLVLVGGIEELVRSCLRARGAEHLPDLADRVSAIAIATIDPGPR